MREDHVELAQTLDADVDSRQYRSQGDGGDHDDQGHHRRAAGRDVEQDDGKTRKDENRRQMDIQAEQSPVVPDILLALISRDRHSVVFPVCSCEATSG